MSLKKSLVTSAAIVLTASSAFAILAGASNPQAAAQQVRPTRQLIDSKLGDVTARLERDLPPMMEEAGVPGLSMGLIRNGELAWQHAFGVMDAKTRQPVTDKTVFEAASLSKPVFAYAVLKLVDSGKFDLDKPLNMYLPGNYDVGSDARLGQITARRVLSHTTGFPNWRGADPALRIFFTPGEKFSYSGEGFVYLSKVIERVTGETFNDFMKRTVFEPLGMVSSSYVWQPSYDTMKTSRHNAAGLPSPQFKAKEAGAASTLHTTAGDYAKFVVAILKGTGLKKETRAAMLTPQVKVDEGGANMTSKPADKPSKEVSWGLGVGLQNTTDGLSFWHWGDNGDAKAYFVAFDREKLGMVMFANSSNGLSIIRELIDESIGGQQPALAWINQESYRSPGRRLLKSILANGAEAGLRDYRKVRASQSEAESINERQMNSLGYSLLYGLNRVKDAIEVFKQNVEDYPESSNVYDSLAEAYDVDGNKELAIRNYQKSIELDPNNTNGIARLKKLKQGQ